MDTLEAMKQALGELDFACDNWIGPMSSAGMREARTNLRTAIEQLESRKPVAWMADGEVFLDKRCVSIQKPIPLFT